MFQYKTDAQLEAMSAAERDTYASEKRNHEAYVAKKAMDEAIKTSTDQIVKEFDEKMTAKETEITSLKEIVEAQGVKIVEMGVKSNPLEGNSLIKEIETHKEGLEGSVKKGRDYEFALKADTLRANVVGNPNALDLTDIGQLAHRSITVYDVFRKVPVPAGSNGVVRYVDWDQATSIRAAKAIAEGTDFVQSTAKWKTSTLTIEKVGDIIPVSEELMYDAPLFAAELKNFLETNIAIKIDTDLVSGNGVSPNINGMKNQIPNYVPVASGIQDCSIYDLLVKTREAITSPYGGKYSPNVAFMNIVDINKMKLKKDNNDNYIMPPFVDKNGNTVNGLLIIECNSYAPNTMVVGDNRYGAIYEIPGILVETGYATGDFESDMMSLKAIKRLNLLIRDVDRTGWLEVTSISAALITLAS